MAVGFRREKRVRQRNQPLLGKSTGLCADDGVLKPLLGKSKGLNESGQ